MAKKKKSTWVAWSEEELKLLRKLYKKVKVREIAELTGRTIAAIAGVDTARRPFVCFSAESRAPVL